MNSETKKFIRYWIEDPFWGGIDHATHAALRMLSPVWCSSIGANLGALAGKYRFPHINRRMVKILDRYYPEKTSDEVQGIIEETWKNVGRVLSEMSMLDKIWRHGNIEVIGSDNVTNHSISGKSTVFLFAHLGNWEMLAAQVLEMGVDLYVVYEHLRNRFQNSAARKARLRTGYHLIEPTSSGIRKIHKALKSGGAVGFAMDEYKKGNVISPSFDNDLSMNTNVAYAIKLAQRYDARLVPAYCLRKNKIDFVLHYLEPISLEGCNDDHESRLKAMSEVNKLLKELVGYHTSGW
ncbi:MAG: hypothetical protein EP297_12350 [Gammaproteobacteria bacterium]|nr:MAG: hypothetical protein EP297_12350 [Gammaproteobacteria bacterium]